MDRSGWHCKIIVLMEIWHREYAGIKNELMEHKKLDKEIRLRKEPKGTKKFIIEFELGKWVKKVRKFLPYII